MIGSCASASAAPATLGPINPVVACASLVRTNIDEAVKAKVTIEAAGEERLDGAVYCRIQGIIAPMIRFELRLPASGWTQRYLQLGCGGLCGVLNIRVEHADDCEPVRDHAIALGSTDMGHQAANMGDGTFGTDPQARIDFAYRGVHLTAVASKALIHTYYGHEPRYAYFAGCSDGGREALMEAQRFPTDFDGISAGAPAMNFLVQNTFYHAWMYLANHRPDGSAILTAAKLPALHAAALASCDAIDGLKDEQITDPRACHFDPADAVCKNGKTPDDSCLSVEEADAARKLYQGPRDAEGHRFTVGGPQVGSELSWRGVFIPETPQGEVMSEGAALGTLRYLAFEHNPDAGYSLNDFHFDQATFRRLEAMHPLYDATDSDLTIFHDRGGKLLLWHGWSDPHISPINTIAYYQAVQSRLGKAKTDALLRLFLFPGMYHCMGGDGTGFFDSLTPLMTWVEGGSAPDRIIASHVDLPFPMGPPQSGKPADEKANFPPLGVVPPRVTRTRPVFAYPMVARYSGSRSVDDAANFSARPPLIPGPSEYDWEGARFMAPGFLKTCGVAGGKPLCR
jgi:feruloyl esterase